MSGLSLFGDQREPIVAEIAERFGSPKLTVELVPTKAWGTNLWSVLRASEWNRLRNLVFEAAGHRCEICGGVGAKWPVACHERWEIEDWSCTQILLGLVALCPACHDVKHIGRAMAGGRGEEARAHLCSVNGWTKKQSKLYLQLVEELWVWRSAEPQWYVDFSWLKQFGIQPRRDATPRRR